MLNLKMLLFSVFRMLTKSLLLQVAVFLYSYFVAQNQ